MSNMVLEVVARIKDEMSGTLGKLGSNLQQFQKGWKDAFVSGVRSTLPDQLGFIADGLEKLPVGALAAAGAFAKIGEYAISAANEVKNTALAFDQLSTKTGASVEFLSQFSVAASNSAISSQQVQGALAKFAQTVYDAKGATGDMQAELTNLADQFRLMADGPEKTAIATKAFGDAGVALIPTLNQGSAAIAEFMAKASAAGQTINGETVAAAKNLDVATQQLNSQLDAFNARVGGAVLPQLANFAAGVNLVAQKADSAQNLLDALLQVTSMLGPSAAGAGTSLMLMGARANAAATAAAQAAQMAAQADAILRSIAGGAAVVLGNVRSSNIAKGQAADVARLQGQYEQLARAQIGAAGGARTEANAQDALNKITAQSFSLNRNHQNSLQLMASEMQVATRTTHEFGGASGGAAAKVQELKSAEDALKESIANVKGMLSGSLQPMDEMERVQTAYAIATGELSAQQFDQQEAVKGLMQAVKDKKITEEQATTTALALANGVAGTADAYAVAGESGKKFADESAKVQGVAATAATKVQEMAKAIKNLPSTTSVDVSATILGMGTVRELKSTMDYLDAHSRHEVIFDVIYRTFGTPPPAGAGGSGTGGANIPPPGGTGSGGGTGGGTGAPPGGRDTGDGGGGGDNNGAGRRKGGGSSNGPLVVLTMDGREVARGVAPYLKLA